MNKILASFAFCLIILGASLIVLRVLTYDYPLAQPLNIVDTGKTWHALAVSEVRLAVYGAPYLGRTSTPKLIAMGASAVREGIRPEDWENFEHTVEVHNLAIGALTPENMIQLWKHIEAAVPAPVAKKSIIMIGVMYAMFNDSWPNLIQDEESRLGPFFRVNVERWAGRDVFNGVKAAVLPLFAMDKIFRDDMELIAKPLDSFIHEHDYPVWVVSHDRALAAWAHLMGDKDILPPDKVEKILPLFKAIRNAGFKVVVVNMPLPSWHSERSPYDHQFQQIFLPRMQYLAKEDDGIIFLDAHDFLPDNYFSDSSHPNREGARLLSQYLYEELFGFWLAKDS